MVGFEARAERVLVTDIIQRAVAGKLGFDFIESSIMAKRGATVSSQKGKATSYSGDGAFLYHFTPRGALPDEWIAPGGYLHARHAERPAIGFTVSGVERNSANWTGELTRLSVTPGSDGPMIHGRAKKWMRSDERSARNAFRRVIIPGKIPFPASIRHAPGHHSRVASIHFETSCLEFRDYGRYTEIAVINGSQLPDYFLEYAVAALGNVLESPLDWVYKERHFGQERHVIVQRPAIGRAPVPETAGTPDCTYHEFWQAYSEALGARL